FSVVCGAGIALVQPGLAATVNATKRDDINPLPPPTQLRAMAFGYRSAAADLLWAKMIVEHGLRWEEKRRFPGVPQYIGGIIAADPDHPILYQFVDSLLLYQPLGGGEEEARLARRYLEQATASHPYDAEVWFHYGQFMAFLAPSFLK